MGRATGLIQLKDSFTTVFGQKRGLRDDQQSEIDPLWANDLENKARRRQFALVHWMIDRGDNWYPVKSILCDSKIYQDYSPSDQQQHCQKDLDTLLSQDMCWPVSYSQEEKQPRYNLKNVADWKQEYQDAFTAWRCDWMGMEFNLI